MGTSCYCPVVLQALTVEVSRTIRVLLSPDRALMKHRIPALLAGCLVATVSAGCDSGTKGPSLVEPTGTAAIEKLPKQPAAPEGKQLRSSKFQQDTLINFMEASFLDINK